MFVGIGRPGDVVVALKQCLLYSQGCIQPHARVCVQQDAVASNGKSFMENLADIVEKRFDETTSKIGNILLTATGVAALANLASGNANGANGSQARGPGQLAMQPPQRPDPAQAAKNSKAGAAALGSSFSILHGNVL